MPKSRRAAKKGIHAARRSGEKRASRQECMPKSRREAKKGIHAVRRSAAAGDHARERTKSGGIGDSARGRR